MFGKFDKDKFKIITKKNGFTQKDLVKKLSYTYMIETKLDAVKSWTRNEERSSPSIDRLNALADMCNCSIQDFFSDAEVKREQIAVEEISAKPERYSNSISKAFLSTMPRGVDKLIENYLLLDEEQQTEIQETMKALAMQNMKF